MKIYNLQAFIKFIYASEALGNAESMHNIDISSYKILAPPGIECMATSNQQINHISDNTVSNPTVAQDSQIDKPLDTLFFTILKNTVSFFLYNISTLRPVFTWILNKQACDQQKIEELKYLLWKHTVSFRIKVMRDLFETDCNVQDIELENLVRCCKGYLRIKNISFENLTYIELKHKVINTSKYFNLSTEEFDMKFHEIRSALLKKLQNHYRFKEESIEPLLNFSYLIYDLISNFTSVYRGCLNLKIYPFLKENKTAFYWVFDTITKLSNTCISKSFFEETADSVFLYFTNTQLASGFIFILYKIVQAEKDSRFFPYDVFSSMQAFLTRLYLYQRPSRKSRNALYNNLTENLKNIFLNFFNKIIIKRNDLKKLEKQNEDAFTYQFLNPAVNDFFSETIEEFKNVFSLSSRLKRANKN